ncbi:MAG: hypothetical protein RG741_10445, partial [Bacteroidales bacterium]|nr:hypothetical protein [Bacteroidales bacterium]
MKTDCVRYLFLFILLQHFFHASAQQLVINEMMASNATTIVDEDGDYEDWVELYNAGNEVINLFGWGLS